MKYKLIKRFKFIKSKNNKKKIIIIYIEENKTITNGFSEKNIKMYILYIL